MAGRQHVEDRRLNGNDDSRRDFQGTFQHFAAQAGGRIEDDMGTTGGRAGNLVAADLPAINMLGREWPQHQPGFG